MDEGIMQMAKFEKGTALIRTAYDGLFGEVDDVRQCVDRIADALNQRPLDERIYFRAERRCDPVLPAVRSICDETSALSSFPVVERHETPLGSFPAAPSHEAAMASCCPEIPVLQRQWESGRTAPGEKKPVRERRIRVDNSLHLCGWPPMSPIGRSALQFIFLSGACSCPGGSCLPAGFVNDPHFAFKHRNLLP